MMQAVDVLGAGVGDRLITCLLRHADRMDAVLQFHVLVLGSLDRVHF